MHTLEVNVKVVPQRYDIHIGYDVLPTIAGTIAARRYGHAYAIVTDQNVRPLYAERLAAELRQHHVEVAILDFPAGERHKTRATKDSLDDRLLERHWGRDGAIIAVGGGVVGDVAGFVAGTYMRGIPYVQVPTTVIAQGDSSIGGKTAVDVPQGKNLIGVFHHPVAVFMDVQTLETLDARNYVSGLVELVKHGLIRDRELWRFLEERVELILARSGPEYPATMVELMDRNCRVKNDVVVADDREAGLRKILNYGHTVGHAVELLSGYSLLHGEAIAIGIVCEGYFSCELGHCSRETYEAQVQVLRRLGLSLEIPACIEVEAILRAMTMDKKARESEAEFVLLEALGRTKVFGSGGHTVRVGRAALAAMLNDLKTGRALP
ncbi:3-dehydroquinate synthase [Myxococcota bacterium]